MVHTGSDGDHILHTDRVDDPPYAPYVGIAANALEADLIRAKAFIAGLPGGSVPTYVRAPEGVFNGTVLATYAAQNLTHKGWDVDSEDSQGGATFASIKTQLTSALQTQLALGDRDIVVLFHDVKGVTAGNLVAYLQLIKTTVASAGFPVQFAKL